MKNLSKMTLLNNIGSVCAAFEEDKIILWAGQYIVNKQHLYNKILQSTKENNYKITITEIKQAAKIKQLENKIEKLNNIIEKLTK